MWFYNKLSSNSKILKKTFADLDLRSCCFDNDSGFILNQLERKVLKKIQTDAKWSTFLSGTICYLRTNNISSLLVLNEMKWEGFAENRSCHSNSFFVSWLLFHCRCSSCFQTSKCSAAFLGFTWLMQETANLGYTVCFSTVTVPVFYFNIYLPSFTGQEDSQ